jgi:23S rRNA-/tRNA-specific pseudouridylate synthase
MKLLQIETAASANADGSKAASTVLQILSSNERFAIFQMNPLTGRKHQLRLVCSQIVNAPIVGDFKYGYEGEKVDGHLLHCLELQFQASLMFMRDSAALRLIQCV